jgi:acetyltransferase
MFGLGGILVEVFKDVVFCLAPIDRNEARRMISNIKGSAILKGVRGKPPVDTDAIERLLVGLSQMVVNHPEIRELDINPLIAYEKGKGTIVADCRIILGPADENGNGR